MIRELALQPHFEAAATSSKTILVTLVTMLLSWDASIQVLGVPLNVLLAAFIGALLGIGYGDPIVPRRRLLMVAIVNAVLAAAIVAVLPHVPFLGWLGKASAGAAAVIVGFLLRWVVPASIERLPAFVRSLIDRYTGSGGKGNPPNSSGGAA